MVDLFIAIFTQSLTFIPLALGISVSYHILRATDMTIDGSFVLGAAIFAKLVTMQISPQLALLIVMICGSMAGLLTACIQRGGKVDPLLAGVLSTFILTSINLLIMGKPNINLLSANTLFSNYFATSEFLGWTIVAIYVSAIIAIAYFILHSRLGLRLRAFADNPTLFKRLGFSCENYRIFGFMLTNMCAATAGCFTAQTVGYADVGMGLGMTLTGIGAIIIGQQCLLRFRKNIQFRLPTELIACLLGVMIYFFVFNTLIRLDVDPIYLKMLLGLLLIIFLRSTGKSQRQGVLS